MTFRLRLPPSLLLLSDSILWGFTVWKRDWDLANSNTGGFSANCTTKVVSGYNHRVTVSSHSLWNCLLLCDNISYWQVSITYTLFSQRATPCLSTLTSSHRTFGGPAGWWRHVPYFCHPASWNLLVYIFHLVWKRLRIMWSSCES